MINKVILTGRLTADPELKKTSSDVSVSAFSVAVQRQYKDGSGNYPTDFINCVAWRNTAEFICKHFKKGNLIALVGELQSRNYEDKQGNKRTAFEVICSEAHFVESKKIDPEFKKPANVTAEDFEEVQDDKLPF
ncbi:MAG: single-stranded DNA-binding protein [Clostridia bacterium]|nr:single-stranded DNA-binding protein [Clostridia bacterium]